MHNWPILEASTAYFRGKWLLDARSSVEIKSLAAQAAAIIDSYFEFEKEQLIQQIKEDGRFDLLETDQNGNNTNRIRDNAIDEYDLYSRDTTTDLEALTNAMGRFFDPSAIEDVKDPKDFEIYAAVAMCYLAQYVRDLKVKLNPINMQWVARTTAKYESNEVVSYASKVIAAMELLWHSKRLHESQRHEEIFNDRLDQHLNQQSIPNDQMIEQIRAETLASFRKEQEFERKRWSEENKQVRHRKNHEAKKIVLESWEIKRKEFKTLVEAGEYYVKVLQEKGYNLTQRTVSGWMSIRAAELGIPIGKR
jgi:hypothetical protein